MKIVNKICQILAVVLSLGALVLFFTKFATIAFSGGEASFVGAELGFGIKKTIGDATYDMARSADILFCFFLTVFGLIFSIFSFKSKGLRYTVPAVGIIDGVYMLVIALSKPNLFVDTRPLPIVSSVTYGKGVLLAAIALILFAIAAAAYLLIDDYLEVKASKGSKKTIFGRIAAFFKDYKSEIKKIVWPGIKEVLKNTLIVLIMCLIVGAFIWLLDFGLGKLLEVILG
ncbi:MAG: preprotein translocase subunit SecE [Clostridia bacterium]|nr:preprotein translocase subunit SecE [Clostridia bacterium]